MNRTRVGTAVIAVAAVGVGFAMLVWLRSHLPTHAALPPVEFDQPVATCGNPRPERVPRISSVAAVECPEAFDGATVTYIGEVVGDVMHRHGGAWVQVNDDDYGLGAGPLAATGVPAGTNSGIAVWIPDADDLDLLPGRAEQRGTVLAVTGEFLRADPADGGGTTIRAGQIETLATGQQLPPPTDWTSIVVGFAGLAAAAALWLRIRNG